VCLLDTGLMNLATTLHSEIKNNKKSVCIYIDACLCVCTYVCMYYHYFSKSSGISSYQRGSQRALKQMFPPAGVVKLSLELDSLEFKAKQLNLQISIR